MRFEYRVEKKVSKKKRERETSGCNFFQNKRAFIGLESWYFILPGKARNSCIAVQKSGEKSGFVSNPVVTIRCARIRW